MIFAVYQQNISAFLWDVTILEKSISCFLVESDYFICTF